MKPFLTTVFALLLLSNSAGADQTATEAATTHVGAILKLDFKSLDGSYAKEVKLMPGHEFLKKRYGLAVDDSRNTALVLDSKTYVDAIKKSAEGRPARPTEKVDAMLKTLKYDALEVAEGDFATAASDPVGTPDGKLHFHIKQGDAVVKVSPPQADFLLLQLRKVDGQWKVVAEYLD
jgi:hypothetical protein